MARVIDDGKAIRLEGKDPLELRREWRLWKPRGYRVRDEDGVTIWHEREAIRRLVLRAFEGVDADLFLFGSQASGAAGKRSDYDVGYLTAEPLGARRLALLKEQLDELPIPGRVEIVDFRGVPEAFARQVFARQDVEIWKKRSKSSVFT